MPGRKTVLPALLALAACSPDSGRDAVPAGVEVRDSAGVRIVSHPPATESPTEVSAMPVASLERGDDEDYLFSRIMGIVALDGGRVVVGESDGTLRIFAADGTLERRTGGNGEGPGEFAFLSRLTRLPGDTVAAPDGRRGRTFFFAPDGSYLDETIWTGRIPPRPEGSSVCISPHVWDVFPDRRLLAVGQQCVVGTGEAGPNAYVGDILTIDDEGVATVATIPIIAVTEDPGAEDAMMRFRTPPVYGRPALVTQGDRILVAIPSLGLRIRGLRTDGSLAFDLRDATPEPPLTPDLQRRIEEGWPSAIALMHDDPIWPETLEGWDTLRVTADGSIWARTMKPGPDPSGELWTVFSSDGTGRERLRMPPGFTLHDARDGRIWGVTTDEMGVEEVVALSVRDE